MIQTHTSSGFVVQDKTTKGGRLPDLLLGAASMITPRRRGESLDVANDYRAGA